MNKVFSALLLILLLLGMWTLAFKVHLVRAGTIVVPDDYPTIQGAIFAASGGDTIFVRNGTYHESVTLYSSYVALVGENKYGTIIDAGLGDAVRMDSVRGVKLTGFTIRNAETGVHLYSSSNNTMEDNIISDNTLGNPFNWGGGISLEHSDDNTIADNIISNITEVGIFHMDSSYNTEVRNVIIQNDNLGLQTTNGIHLGDLCHDNTILNNTISKSLVGIYASQLAYNNTIAGNTIENLTSYECGINIWGPSNTISRNIITGMSYVGIQLNSYSSDGLYGTPNACADNIVVGNVISNCTFGINLILAAFSNTIAENNVSSNSIGILISDSSNNNTVLENLISNNENGLLMFSSNNSKVYHNYFTSNTEQVLLSDSFQTTWDDGYPSGGNYWSDYVGVDSYSGPYQNETGSDGIGDVPYVIDALNLDSYPLMSPWIHIAGDLNFDGKVSLADLTLLALAYKSQLGDLNWNSMADLAAPFGLISLTDLVTMAMHYGQHNP